MHLLSASETAETTSVKVSGLEVGIKFVFRISQLKTIMGAGEVTLIFWL